MGVLSEVRDLCDAFVVGLRDELGDKLHAVYVYGAVTFPETEYTGDVDFHVILTAPPDDAERAVLLELHERLAREFPPLGAELDGYYILLADARGRTRPHHVLLPEIVDESWALHRAHILAGRVFVLHGPQPATIYAVPTWVEIAEALDGELDYVTRHLEHYPAYCVLNLCRLLYSWETRDVVTSKAASAAWARTRVPDRASLINLALKSYAHQASSEDCRALERGVTGFHAYARRTIESLRLTRTP